MLAYYLLFQISLFFQFYFPLSARYFPPPAFLSLSSVSQISSFLSVPHFFTFLAMANESSKAFEEIVPQSVSASASSSKPMKKRVPFDVFINHRGPDSKHTLAASIYSTLKHMGLEVFLDEPELDVGDSIPDEIEYAMTTSFLHIAILSPNYAESPWCLEELSFMVKTGNTIIPVFYNVDISDIRWVKGVFYADGFSKYEENRRYSSEKLEEWKIALQKVTYLEGHIVKDNDDEGKLKLLKAIEEYVKKHSQKLPLVVANHPVGLDEIVQDFESSAFDSSEDVKIVGIIGMGGCGKTTLAKEYYNRKRYSIYKCSFIFNVKDVSKKDLQKKMLEDLGFHGKEFDDVESGKAVIAKHLRSVQVFIILDDVDSRDQLESLLPIKDSLGHDSIIIVTSRESDILTSWGISSIFKMKKLNPEHAMSLFCYHAFPQASLMNEFESRVQKFLSVCQGLPLSLKVLGGLVRGKSQDYWDAQLNKISSVLPKDIKSILKVRFDALDEEEKEMFLDICCFFIREEWSGITGRNKQLAVTVWDGSGWNGLSGLTVLENKCLVEFDERNCITMRDHLRDLGKQIVLRKEIAKSPYRLWSREQFDDIKMEGQESVLNRGVRGIIAETEDIYEQCMELVDRIGSRKWFKRRLEILFVRGNYFTEELATLSAGLVWLRWIDFPHTALPSWLSLNKLRILELRCAGELEQLWSETADPPVQLRELIIHGAKNGLSSLENAESLTRVEVSAWNMWAIEPCLQTIKKWPGECIICAGTARGVEEVVKSLTFPALTLVDSCSRQTDWELGYRSELLTLECGQRGCSNEAAMLCFVINSSSNRTSLKLLNYENAGFHVGKGKWLWIGVFTQPHPLVSEDKFVLKKSFWEEHSNSSDDDEEHSKHSNSSDDDEEHSKHSNSSDEHSKEHSKSSDDEDMGMAVMGEKNSSDDDEEHSKHSNSSDDEEHSNSSEDDEDMGMAVMGEKEKVVEAFYELLHHLNVTRVVEALFPGMPT